MLFLNTQKHIVENKMNLKRTVIMVMSMLVGSSVFAENAPAATSFNANQVQGIEKIVHDYLVQHPEVLIEASQALQAKQQQQMQKEANSFINGNAQELITESLTVAGSKTPSVTIVEFFDYQCGHCKKMHPVLVETLKKNPNVKVVFREFPIFGKTSLLASQAAVAAAMQGKYAEMQQQLFAESKIDDAIVLADAKKIGLNITKFQEDMKSKTVQDYIAHNRKLADSMKLFGTPVFIVMSTPNNQFNPNVQPVMIPGSTTAENLQQLITKASEAK